MSSFQYELDVSDALCKQSKEFDLGLEVGFRMACETYTGLKAEDITLKLQSLRDFLNDPNRPPVGATVGHRIDPKHLGGNL